MVVKGQKKLSLLIKNWFVTILVFSFFFLVVGFAINNGGLEGFLYIPVAFIILLIFYILINDYFEYKSLPSDVQFDLDSKKIIGSGISNGSRFKSIYFVSNDKESRSYRVSIVDLKGKERFLTRHFYFDVSIGDIQVYLSSKDDISIQVISSRKYVNKSLFG